MDKEIVYVRASDDWSIGVFAKYFADGWHFVYWSYADDNSEPKFVESCSIKSQWAANILKENHAYPVYQEYRLSDNAPL